MKRTIFFFFLSFVKVSKSTREFRKSSVVKFNPRWTLSAESAVKSGWRRNTFLSHFVKTLCSLHCSSEIGCFSFSFEDGICQLGAFHDPPEGQSALANKTCYVDTKGETTIFDFSLYITDSFHSGYSGRATDNWLAYTYVQN